MTASHLVKGSARTRRAQCEATMVTDTRPRISLHYLTTAGEKPQRLTRTTGAARARRDERGSESSHARLAQRVRGEARGAWG